MMRIRKMMTRTKLIRTSMMRGKTMDENKDFDYDGDMDDED